ncbi:MAG: hypothetical protein ACK5CA_15925 [Cyanobacteriota bacterium]|jgi:hypothetical protein
MSYTTTEKITYLLYARAYAEGGSVTKGVVKDHLPKEPKELKESADAIYADLKAQGLIETTAGKPTKRDGRFSLTEEGVRALVNGLASTDYRFESVKGPKILNTLVEFILPLDDMTFEEFEKKFKKLYFQEKRRQELDGVVAIYSKDLCQKFANDNSISQKKLGEYFERLKTTGKILAVMERGDELMQWVG